MVSNHQRKVKSPHSLLFKDIYKGNKKGEPQYDPKKKYSTLSQLGIPNYLVTFQELHVELVVSFCKYVLQKQRKRGMDMLIFCKKVCDKVSSLNETVGDTKWNTIFTVISRFAAMPRNMEYIENNNGNNRNLSLEQLHMNEISLKL